MSTSIGDDIIDSRNIDERIDELRAELDGTPFSNVDYDADKLAEILDETSDEWKAAVENWDDDAVEELVDLVKFRDEGQNATSEWTSGATFILDDHFQDYAEELANDIGAVNSDASWPTSCIDWAEAASQLKQDYTTIEVGGHTYHTRG